MRAAGRICANEAMLLQQTVYAMPNSNKYTNADQLSHFYMSQRTNTANSLASNLHSHTP